MNETELAVLWSKTQRFLNETSARYHGFYGVSMMVYRDPGKFMREESEFCVRCLYKPSMNGKYYEIEGWVGWGITLSEALMNLQKKVQSLFPPDKYPPDKYPPVDIDD